MRRGELVARLVAAVVRPCSRAVVRSADGPALAPSRRARVRGRSSHYNSVAADALRCGRRRPRQPGAARGAVFESMRPVEGRLRAFALRLRCSALSSSPAQQRLRAQFKLSIRRVCTSLVINVAIYAGPRRARDHLSNRDVASKLFCLKSSVRCRIRLRSADARLGRPWPELGGFWPTIGAAPPPPRSFVRGADGRLDISLQCTAARAGVTREGVRAAFTNRLCESLGCLDLRER